MKETSYAFTVGYIRALENHLLDLGTLERLTESADLTDLTDRLNSLGYEVKRVTNLEDFSLQLDEYFNSTCDFIQKSCPSVAQFKWLWLKNDVFNYKAVLKSTFGDGDWHELLLTPYTIDPTLMQDCIKSRDFEAMPDYFKELAQDSFEILSRTSDSSKMELYIDNSMFKVMLNLSDGDEFLLKRTRLNITLKNLVMAVRYLLINKNADTLSDYFIEGGLAHIDKLTYGISKGMDGLVSQFEEIGFVDGAEKLIEDPMLVEQWAADKLAEFDRDSSSSPFGFAPVVSYVKRLLAEHRRLREIAMTIVWDSHQTSNGERKAAI